MSEELVPEAGDVKLGEWLQGEGPNADIAICTRVRFARNVEGFRFSICMSDEEAAEVTAYIRQQLHKGAFVEELHLVDLADLDELELRWLIERHMISREMANANRSRCVAMNDPESVSVMINEEDHIRAQVFQSGLRIEDTYRRAERMDESLMSRMPLAFSEEFGFLTSCPTNTGTGLRVSVMLHLPGLVWAEEIDKAVNTAQKIHLTVRGLYGEGSRALGDFYQVSNQVTLGRAETQIVTDVSDAVAQIVSWERKVRGALLRGEQRARTEDRVHRAVGVLERARILTSEEALDCLSAVRFGIREGVLDSPTLRQVNCALLLSQPAHLQRLWKGPLTPVERDLKRATLVRKLIAGG